MRKKRLIPRPAIDILKSPTALGYSFQVGGVLPSFRNGGMNPMMYQQGGSTVPKNQNTGSQTTNDVNFNLNTVDIVGKKSNYVRRGRAQTQAQVNKNNQALATIRSRFPEVNSQQQIIDLLDAGRIKPYEAQLLIQAIAIERARELGQQGKITPKYKDDVTGITFDLKENGAITAYRDELNNYLAKKAKEKNRSFRGFDNLTSDMEYDLGVVNQQPKIVPPPPPPPPTEQYKPNYFVIKNSGSRRIPLTWKGRSYMGVENYPGVKEAYYKDEETGKLIRLPEFDETLNSERLAPYSAEMEGKTKEGIGPGNNFRKVNKGQIQPGKNYGK
jgi:hypothetical protein